MAAGFVDYLRFALGWWSSPRRDLVDPGCIHDASAVTPGFREWSVANSGVVECQSITAGLQEWLASSPGADPVQATTPGFNEFRVGCRE